MRYSKRFNGTDPAVRLAKVSEGVERFNRLEFWEAHDSWEKVWLTAPDDEAKFVQGLIQIAAAYLHVQRRATRPAVRLFALGLAKLSRYDPAYYGIDRGEVVAAAARHREWLLREGGGKLPESEFPRISHPTGTI